MKPKSNVNALNANKNVVGKLVVGIAPKKSAPITSHKGVLQIIALATVAITCLPLWTVQLMISSIILPPKNKRKCLPLVVWNKSNIYI